MSSSWHRFVDHTAELQLELEGATKEAVLVEATVALGELLGGAERPGEAARRQLAVTAPDDPALLAAWLDELVFLAESEGFIPRGVEALAVEDGGASGVVTGAYGSPPHLVKAVTYHMLELSFDGRMWHGTVVLDV